MKKNKINNNLSHQIINKKINLYYINKDSPGMIFWDENGLYIFEELKKLIREKLLLYSYNEVKTPVLINKKLWIKSEHYNFFNKNMFSIYKENREFCIKPMNCPGHIYLFKNKLRSYSDLPLRISEFGNCFRIEPSGSLYGLMRTNSFVQDDAHIFCLENQIYDEIYNCISIINNVYSIFNFNKINIKFSTRPKFKIGDDILWDKSENLILNILNNNKIKFDINVGEGSFYGPKIEFILFDYINRPWQCGTIQLDLFLSNKLNAYYIDKDNNKKNPIIIHRAILGSIERFIGIITEHFQGKYPVWISPIQIVIININDNNNKYIFNLYNKLLDLKIRVKIDLRNKNIKYKIRENIILNIPYIIVIGDKEIKNNILSIRERDKDYIYTINYEEFLIKIKNEIKNRVL
ncbi:threonine--tRNA ligase [endosymbiont of Sipalinus gigas]|uniref:threonine--tRNA ligase n=1 Tax=endosymbiont of Sipalinus gigas TaxID=1972134 RepID=UPI000DC70183|nr:threonine--tRNA ligase [endosymbiont of Sipalinus gigas]BBA85228.1 threonine--tRNA ligase [endosymbiont of Sipalinus gigas]